MLDCGHVFCVCCLKDFYGNAITEGDVSSVRCLEPSCAQERERKEAAETGARGSGSLPPRKRRKPRTFISPSELLQIPIETELVRRYVRLIYKNELESDKNTIYCPRKWCQGAARSKKHKKPEGLELCEVSDDDEEDAGTNDNREQAPRKDDLLAVCEDCGFAFCSKFRLSLALNKDVKVHQPSSHVFMETLSGLFHDSSSCVNPG